MLSIQTIELHQNHCLYDFKNFAPTEYFRIIIGDFGGANYRIVLLLRLVRYIHRQQGLHGMQRKPIMI